MTLAIEYARMQIIQALTIFSSNMAHDPFVVQLYPHQKESTGKTVKLKSANNLW